MNEKEQWDKMWEDFERRVNELKEELERLSTEFTQRVKGDGSPPLRKKQLHQGRLIWGLILVGAGLFWWMKNMGWIDINFPWVQAALIAIGLHLILTSKRSS